MSSTHPRLPGAVRWEYDDLARLRERVESYGLRLEPLENTPIRFSDRAMLGLPGRDEQISAYQQTIRNLGRAGIPVLGYHFMPNGVWRTSRRAPGRGGAICTAFDLQAGRDVPLSHGRIFGDAPSCRSCLIRPPAGRRTALFQISEGELARAVRPRR